MNRTIYCAALACLATLTAAKVPAADKLSDILRESKWGGIIGTWVDADTKGANFKITYAWKLENRVVEITSKQGGRESVALMGVNGKTGEVFHMGADSAGTSSLGKWEVDDNGDAVLGIAYTNCERSMHPRRAREPRVKGGKGYSLALVILCPFAEQPA